VIARDLLREWLHSEPVLPVPVAHADAVALQVPVLTRHRLLATARIAHHDALVIGVLPAGAPGMVAMLCVQVDVSGTLVAAR
jgi:hypothetical protein